MSRTNVCKTYVWTHSVETHKLAYSFTKSNKKSVPQWEEHQIAGQGLLYTSTSANAEWHCTSQSLLACPDQVPLIDSGCRIFQQLPTCFQEAKFSVPPNMED